MKAYLDNNIIVDIEEGIKSLDKVIECVNPAIKSIFFSSAHIGEAEELTDKSEKTKSERISHRMKLIGEITGHNYIYQNMENEVFFQIRTPESVLETNRDTPSSSEIMKGLVSIMSEDQKQQFRKMLGVDPKQINNYSPNNVLEQLNLKLTNWGMNQSFMEMIDHANSFHPDSSSFGLNHKIASMFEFLDIIGYWKDKSTEKSNYARFWDSNHSFYAAHCDYFISDDTRTRNKAKVVYHQLGIGTKVVASTGKE